MRRQTAALWLALLCAAAGTARALTIATAADFLEANADEFQCFNALVARSGLAGALTADLPNTYFLPSDAAFITDLGQTAPALDVGSSPTPLSADLSVAQIVDMIEAMPTDRAVAFLKAHVVPKSFPTVSSLAFPGGRPTTAPDPSFPVISPTIKNSLGQTVEVVYEYAYNAMHLEISTPTDQIVSYVAGPLAIPAGQATIYPMLNLLASSELITGAVPAASTTAPSPVAAKDDASR